MSGDNNQEETPSTPIRGTTNINIPQQANPITASEEQEAGSPGSPSERVPVFTRRAQRTRDGGRGGGGGGRSRFKKRLVILLSAFVRYNLLQLLSFYELIIPGGKPYVQVGFKFDITALQWKPPPTKGINYNFEPDVIFPLFKDTSSIGLYNCDIVAMNVGVLKDDNNSSGSDQKQEEGGLVCIIVSMYYCCLFIILISILTYNDINMIICCFLYRLKAM